MTDVRYRWAMNTSLRGLAEKGVLAAVVTVVSVVFLWMIWGLFMPIFAAVVLAILFHPVYEGVVRRMPRFPGLASGITLIITVAFVAVPMYVLGSLLLQQALDVYQAVSDDPARVFASVMQVVPEERLAQWGISADDARAQLATGMQTVSATAFGIAAAATTGTLSFAFKAAIALYLMFFLLKDGRKILQTVSHHFPLPDRHERALFERFVSTVRAVVKGGLIVALAQGIFGGVLFWAVGIPNAVLWGAVMSFLALIPFAGPALVWVPAAAFLLYTGEIFQALMVAVGGSLVVGTIDNLLRPYLVGRDTQMPDGLILISVIGGLSAFGAGGIVVGPVVAALFLSVWQMFGTDTSR